jgi:hypothetical protein
MPLPLDAKLQKVFGQAGPDSIALGSCASSSSSDEAEETNHRVRLQINGMSGTGITFYAVCSESRVIAGDLVAFFAC